jgi:hypothetical protein
LFFQFGEAPQVLKEQRAEYLWKQLERPIPDIRQRSKAQLFASDGMMFDRDPQANAWRMVYKLGKP